MSNLEDFDKPLSEEESKCVYGDDCEHTTHGAEFECSQVLCEL